MNPGSGRRAVRIRRSPHLVAYWRNRTLVACNYATGTKAEVTSRACELLDFCHDWTPLDEIKAAGLLPPSTLFAAIDRLVKSRGRLLSRDHA
jgi:hypothetical protein